MRQVNDRHGAHASTNITSMTIGEFWEEEFRQSMLDRKLAASTKAGYEKTWKLYLSDHLSKRRLIDYTTPDASKFLKSLVTENDLNSNTLAHCRALMSNIFALAVVNGLVGKNPIHDAKVVAAVREPNATEYYTLLEARLILKALEPRLDAQCIFACAFFMGLRPSEIAGLKVEDLTSDGRLHIRRAVVNGEEGDTKTEDSTEKLLLIEPLKGLLDAWIARRGRAEGWMFPSQRGGPLNVESFCRNTLIPLFKIAGLEWKALYSARRGIGTTLRDLSGNLGFSQQVLRHKAMATTDNHYALPSQGLADAGFKMLESAFLDAPSKV